MSQVPVLPRRLRSCYPFPSCHCLFRVVRLDGEKWGWRGSALLMARPPACSWLSAAAGSRVDVGAVFGVDSFFAHGRQLSALRHEHDHESDGGASDQSATDANILKINFNKTIGRWNDVSFYTTCYLGTCIIILQKKKYFICFSKVWNQFRFRI